MSLRAVIDQSHGEFLKDSNTTILQALLAEMGFIIFPLIDRPITLEQIKEDHILFVGCPSVPFQDSELRDIVKFVEMGKFLFLINGSGGDYANNSNLSKLSRFFEFEFNPDYVEDEKHHLNFARIPLVQRFKKNPIFKNVKKLVYSGCSISVLDESTSALCFTDTDAIPVNSPLMVLSGNHLVFGLGGYSLFSDDPEYGIKAQDNLRFVYNLFELIKTRFGKVDKEIQNEPVISSQKITLKTAKKQFLKLISVNIQKMNELSEKIDLYWTNCSDLIKQKQYISAEKLISLEYQQLLQIITTIASEIGNNFNEYDSLFPEFKPSIVESFNQWYESEAEIRAKLDMIRNNLVSTLSKEKR